MKTPGRASFGPPSAESGGTAHRTIPIRTAENRLRETGNGFPALRSAGPPGADFQKNREAAE